MDPQPEVVIDFGECFIGQPVNINGRSYRIVAANPLLKTITLEPFTDAVGEA